MGNELSLSNEGTPLDNNLSVTWKQVNSSSPLAAREGQSYCTMDNKLYIYGGVIQGCNEDIATTNSLICFDSENDKWSECENKGDAPQPSSGSTLAAVGSSLYVFGGLNQEVGWFNTIHEYNTKTSTWSLVKASGTGPSSRDKLASVAVGKNIYYFGGFGPKVAKEGEEEEEEEAEGDGEASSSSSEETEEGMQQKGVEFKWFDDLFIFNTESKSWTQPMHMNLSLPSARAAASVCVSGRDLVIFGGRDSKGRRNDVHTYNIDSRKWTKHEALQGRQPASRSYHGATMVGDRMIVMGGRCNSESHFADMHVLDLAMSHWLQPKVTGDIPAPRGQHSVGVCGDYLIVHGGSAQFDATTMQCQQHFTDTYKAKIDTITNGVAKTEVMESNNAIKS